MLLKPLTGLGTEGPLHRASLAAQTVKNLPAIWETQVRPLGQEDPLEKGKATHTSLLARRVPWTEDLAGFVASQRVRLLTE